MTQSGAYYKQCTEGLQLPRNPPSCRYPFANLKHIAKVFNYNEVHHHTVTLFYFVICFLGWSSAAPRSVDSVFDHRRQGETLSGTDFKHLAQGL